jgi:copper homeostasis protein
VSGVSALLEVIVTSVADAIAAEQGGATRLEVVSHLDQDGLTPSLALVEDLVHTVRIPIRVMLRERNDFVVRNRAELDRLCDVARALAELTVDGLVLGFLCSRDGAAGAIDIHAMQHILGCAPNLKATFHRAFEAVNHSNAALSALKELPQVDCVLTSGGDGSWLERANRLKTLNDLAQPNISILVGGGVNEAVIDLLCSATPIRAFHLGRAVREPQTVTGVVSAERVATLQRRLAIATGY